MTESEWLAPIARNGIRDMLYFARHLSDRKTRLFACACVRQVWPLLEAAGRRAVEVAERFADGEATADELDDAYGDTSPSSRGASNESHDACFAAHWMASDPGHVVPTDAAEYAAEYAALAVRRNAVSGGYDAQADLLRDIVGNPFRPVTLKPCSRCDGDGQAHGSDRPFDWTGPGSYPGPCPVCCGRRSPWVTSDVLSLAQSVYGKRDESSGHLDPFLLRLLADALEDAGCPSDEERTAACDTCGGRGKIVAPPGDSARYWPCPMCGLSGEVSQRSPHPLLTHLRSPGPHVRGCFAVDLVLGLS